MYPILIFDLEGEFTLSNAFNIIWCELCVELIELIAITQFAPCSSYKFTPIHTLLQLKNLHRKQQTGLKLKPVVLALVLLVASLQSAVKKTCSHLQTDFHRAGELEEPSNFREQFLFPTIQLHNPLPKKHQHLLHVANLVHVASNAPTVPPLAESNEV